MMIMVYNIPTAKTSPGTEKNFGNGAWNVLSSGEVDCYNYFDSSVYRSYG